MASALEVALGGGSADDQDQSALLAFLAKQAGMSPGAYSGLKRSVIDPETGIPVAAADAVDPEAIVKRGNLLPIGYTADGRPKLAAQGPVHAVGKIAEHVVNSALDAPTRLAKLGRYVSKVADGEPLIDPQTGEYTQDALGFGLEGAQSVQSGGMAGGAGAGGKVLGSGPVLRTAENLGMGSEKTYWSDLAKTKHPIAVEDMRATRIPTGELADRKVLNPEDLQGSILQPAIGDRTVAGHTLTAINDKPLAYPVALEGGPEFMRAGANQADGAAWASGQGVVSRLAKHARTTADATGKDINLVYSSMGARSGDYSHMMTDGILAQLPGSPIARSTMKDFDAAMRAKHPSWEGLDSDTLRQQLLASGPLRKDFVELSGQGKFQKEGFPDIGSTRYAISEKELIGQPTGVSGMAVSKLDPTGRIIKNPSVPHSTYDTQMAGLGYRGGIEAPIPRDVMFPNFYRDQRAAGAKPITDDYTFGRKAINQPADQQWLDGIMKYIAQAKAQ